MVWILGLAAIAGIPVVILVAHVQRKRRQRREFLRHLQWALRDTGG